MGCGAKKYVAINKAANAIGSSYETIRGWEKELKQYDQFIFELNCAHIAGKFSVMSEDEFKRAKEDDEYNDVYGVMTYMEMAEYILKTHSNQTYEMIGQNIREFRSKPSSGESTG
jgi:hypothetical protein